MNVLALLVVILVAVGIWAGWPLWRDWMDRL